jgi:glycosyltransferase involved in cell wall biosynthesis
MNGNTNESPPSAKIPAVSVIVPAHNDEKYIAECLDSVLAQTFQDYEVICIDDGSADGSLSIFEDYARRDTRIKVMHQENQGVVSARNNAIAAARGEYVLPLDSDDILAPECIEALHNFITTHDYAIVCPGAQHFKDTDEGRIYLPYYFWKPTKWNNYRRFIGHNSSMYPKAFWEKYGGYDHLFDSGMEDYDFWLNFIDDGQKAILLHDILFFYRVKSNEESRCRQCGRRVAKKVYKQLRANMRRKHPKIIIYKTLYNITRFFFRWQETDRGLTLRILRIPIYRKANGGLTAAQKPAKGNNGMNTGTNESPPIAKGPAVSVIVPAHNDEKYIAECLDSVLAQTFQDYEVICIDDGSADGSLSIFEDYARRDTRIKVMHQENQGVVSARNNAIAAARGEYIFPLDSDDMIAPDCLGVLHNFIATHDCAVVCPGARFFRDHDTGRTYHTWYLPKPTKWNMYGRHTGIHNSSMYPKALWEKYGGYDHLFDNGKEDFDFWLNFIDDARKVVLIPDPLFFYRQKPADESRVKRCSYRVAKQARKQLGINLRRKHPKKIVRRALYNITRHFFAYKATELGLTLYIFRIPVYRRSGECIGP